MNRWASWSTALVAALLLVACDDATGSLEEAAYPDDAAVAAGGSGEPGGAGGEGPGPRPGAAPCEVGEQRCTDGKLRVCREDEDGLYWLVEACPEGTFCIDAACEARACDPGARSCVEGGVALCDADGTGYGDVTACPDDTGCVEGVCLGRTCAPGETACAEKTLLVCNEAGLGWDRTPCAAGERCVDGQCEAGIPGSGSCPPGEVLCGAAGVFACNETGDGWTETPCAEREACFEGRCVACVRDANCGEAQVCVDGACAPAPLEPVRLTTERLPVGQVGVEYSADLEAEGGTPPYRFSVEAGPLPPGLVLEPDGHLSGTPETDGAWPLTLRVTDAADQEDSQRLRIEVVPEGAALRIVTESPLPGVEEGNAYETSFEAVGGTAPYGFFLIDGALPQGLALEAGGRLAGTPTEIGTFRFTLRAVDASTPPAFTEKAFELTVSVAPLEIYGEQELNLFVAKLITLPTLTIIPNIPLPYDTNLLARGGQRPYTFTEEDLPDFVAGFIPNSGIPDGLVLDEDGRLQGSVADASQVIDVTIPFTMIRLTGFFFAVRVTDSQNPAQTADALFVLPTLPLGG
jgi:hypothetical protein